MKRKLSISGVLSMLLVFGVFLFTGCPGGDDGDGGFTIGDNTGGNNTGGDNTGGNNTGNTVQEGVYIGIISFAGTANDLTGGVPVFLDASGKTSLLNKLNSNYTISSAQGTALFYSVHQALANLKSRETQYPANLTSVNVVTFTDGLDNGSTGMSAVTPIEGQTFDSDNEYTTYLSQQIASRTIAGKSITAYSVGVSGEDVSDATKFDADLAKIASPEKSQRLTNFEQLQTTFQSIADSLEVIAHTNTTFTMKTTLLASGTKVRMTFDVTGTNPTDAAASTKYIEGTITRTGTGSSMVYTFGSITYAGGLGSSQGVGPITGAINGSEVNFAFTGVTGYNPSTDESTAKQWLMAPDATAWQRNSEYSISGATDTQIEQRSSIIYLVLDSSKSLNTTQIGQIRSAAADFINSLYTQINGSSTTTAPSAPTGVSASASSSSSITVSWDPASNASSYYIYRATSSSGSYSYVASTSSTSYTNTGLSSGTTYYYKVSAHNSYGEGSQSSYTYATTSSSSSGVPSAPTGVSASASSSSSITVSWNSVSNASGYYIYRATSSSGSYSYVTSTSSTSYTNTGLSSGTTYYYKVSAYNSSYGEGSQPSYTYATTPSSSASLSNNTWYSTTLYSGDTHYYSFYANSGYYYDIYWEDYGYSNSYGDIIVSAMDSSGSYLFSNVDAGYSGQEFYVSSSGTITLIVQGHSSSSSGTYRIKFLY
ncbi:MAG: fibronectin type III domain-containing protein [Treponema sp.]|jgi:hypothetical protein|nr:fibronectin type III domain-containing protein [Treponema sp.]